MSLYWEHQGWGPYTTDQEWDRPRCSAYGDDMASDRQTELRLSRLENDSNSLYDLVT
jgi:hypothetical protein